MAEVTPTNPTAPKRLVTGIKPDGAEAPIQLNADGKQMVDIVSTVADDVSIQATVDDAADTNIWGDGAGAAAALTAVNAYGTVIATGGKSNWTLKCNLSNDGAGITQVELIVEVANAATGTFFPIQVQTVGGDGEIVLTDAIWHRTVAAADRFAFDVDIKGNAVFRVGARASVGAPAGSAFLITAQPAGV